MIRVVFDTNILYSAIIQPLGQPAKAFDLAISGRVIPCVTDAVLEEYHEVLHRPEFDLHAQRRRRVLEEISIIALHVTPAEEELHISPDKDDNRIYECAAASLAHYIVTGNTKHFTKPYKTTKIITARQLLELAAAGAF